MSILSALLIPVLSLAADPFTGTLGCRVTDATKDSVFSKFVGGKIVIDLRDGSTMLHQGDAAYAPISPMMVSSHGAARERCTYGTEVLWAGEKLRAMLFKFNGCVHRDSASGIGGYVRADVGFDLFAGHGKYREIFLTPVGPVPSAFVDFAGCELHGEASSE